MVQLTGFKKINTAVFISGTGSNLKSLIKFSKLKKSPISINIIISNNPRSKGLELGKTYKIKKKVFDFKNTLLAEKKILIELNKNKINLICLAGFMKILSKNFIKNFDGKILNIHPSLLPKYITVSHMCNLSMYILYQISLNVLLLHVRHLHLAFLQ